MVTASIRGDPKLEKAIAAGTMMRRNGGLVAFNFRPTFLTFRSIGASRLVKTAQGTHLNSGHSAVLRSPAAGA